MCYAEGVTPMPVAACKSCHKCLQLMCLYPRSVCMLVDKIKEFELEFETMGHGRIYNFSIGAAFFFGPLGGAIPWRRAVEYPPLTSPGGIVVCCDK